MQISFILPHLKIYGGIRRILELSNHLVGRGHQVTIFHSDGSPCTWMECYADIAPALAILDQEHESLIYNSPTVFELDLVALARAKRRVFFCLELYDKELMLPGFSLNKFKLWKTSTRWTLLLKKGMLDSDLILVNASWLKGWIKENLGLESILVLGGVNTEMFHPVAVPKDPHVIRIVYSGDPRPRKGTRVVEAACKIVQAKVPNVVLDTYYGKGIPQTQMAQMYSSADIFVDGQFSAGWNNPVAEAMACKVPVVCSDIGGVWDFAFDKQTALLVPPHDVEATAEAILQLVNDPALRQQLSENAYQHILTFKWDESAIRLEGILADALNHPPVRHPGSRSRFERAIERFLIRVLSIHYHRYISTEAGRVSRNKPLGFLRYTIGRWLAGAT